MKTTHSVVSITTDEKLLPVTLRDYFAAHALANTTYCNDLDISTLAKSAHAIADALLIAEYGRRIEVGR